MNPFLIYAIGLLAQLLFSARSLVQWILSERAKKVLSPVLFWQLSMVASFTFCLYGWLRNDFALIAGQLISYYIYIWNLKIQGAWEELGNFLCKLFFYTPIVAIAWGLFYWENTTRHLFVQQNIPGWLIAFGTTGQVIFTLRFIYQWWISKKINQSVLPLTFWVISLTGSIFILIYGIIRHDPIVILGQSTGAVVYIRNIMLSSHSPDE